MSRHRPGRRLTALMRAGAALTTLALIPVLAVTGSANAAGNLPAPGFVTVSDVTGDVVTSPVVGDSKPPVITSVGNSVTVTVSLWVDSTSVTAAAFRKDTDVTLTSGGVSVTRVFPAGLSQQTFTTAAFTTAVNKTTVAVSFPTLRGKSALPEASSPTVFDVLRFVTTASAGLNYTRSVGADGAACGDVTPQQPYCATVLLPNGAGNIVLGTGACDGSSYTNCDAAHSYVFELLANLNAYSTTSPATVILSCDKLYCGKGAIKNNVPHFTTSGSGNLDALPACAAKGVAPATGGCVDYVQSTRDNAGDTHLYVLFARDARMSCC